MGDVVEFSGKSKRAAVDVVRRDEAVEKVRQILRGIGMMEGSACNRMMDLGDVLIPVRDVAGYRAWGVFLNDCRLPKRDAQIAMQLAKARPVIESENAKRASLSQPPLSIRAALELIRPPQATRKAPQDSENIPITVDAVLTWLRTATYEQKRRVAAALSQDAETARKFLRAKPTATPEQLYRRAMGLLLPEEGAPAVH
jgi:hypothetical protein